MWGSNQDSKIGMNDNQGMSKSNSTTLIAADTQLTGDIAFAGELNIEGQILGNITGSNQQQTAINVFEKGVIKGDIIANKVTIKGTVTGKITCELLDLKEKALVTGDVQYKHMEMTRGARIKGQLIFAEAQKPQEAPSNNKAPRMVNNTQQK